MDYIFFLRIWLFVYGWDSLAFVSYLFLCASFLFLLHSISGVISSFITFIGVLMLSISSYLIENAA